MEETSFLDLINAHQGIIHKICRLYRDSREDREDLFQEIVFQLWKSLPSFQGKATFSTWMYRIALSTAISAFRKRQPDISYTKSLPDQQWEQHEEDEQWERLFNSLRRLNDSDKALITLYLENLSYQQIAEISGITENNVGVKLNRIKQKIQQFLKD